MRSSILKQAANGRSEESGGLQDEIDRTRAEIRTDGLRSLSESGSAYMKRANWTFTRNSSAFSGGQRGKSRA
jgi:hypothetical protein